MSCVVKQSIVCSVVCGTFFFFQAEDGIRDLVRSRGLGDVYKRQAFYMRHFEHKWRQSLARKRALFPQAHAFGDDVLLSLIHI